MARMRSGRTSMTGFRFAEVFFAGAGAAAGDGADLRGSGFFTADFAGVAVFRGEMGGGMIFSGSCKL
jgi:hypothetical protein